MSKCKVVTVTSGKGGVGKTVFIINFGIELANQGKKVVLFDADLGMANIDVLLKISAKQNLMEVIEGKKTINDVLIDGPGGIKIVPGASGFKELANLEPVQFERLLNGIAYLESNFDYLLVDTGAGLSSNVTNFVLASHETIIITTPEPHAITDAYSIIKVITELCRDIKLKLVVNKSESIKEALEVQTRLGNAVKQFLNFSLESFGNITESTMVGKSIRQQNPLCLLFPNSDAAKDIRNLAKKEVQMISGIDASTRPDLTNPDASYYYEHGRLVAITEKFVDRLRKLFVKK